MTFNEKVKLEIIQNDYDLDSFKIILKFFLLNGVQISEECKPKVWYWKIKHSSVVILEFIKNNLKKFFQIKSEIIIAKKNHRFSFLKIDKNAFSLLLKEFDLDCEKVVKSKKNYQNIMIGIFLNSGIVCDVEKNIYHAEIKINKKFLKKIVLKILTVLKIENKVYDYHHKSKIYIKRVDAISDFLKLINAPVAMMLVEEFKISKDFINQTQRMTNLDVANLTKTTYASYNHIKMIKFLQSQKPKIVFNSVTEIFMIERIKNPEASLNELVEILYRKHKIVITKSGVNHILRKLRYCFNQVKKL